MHRHGAGRGYGTTVAGAGVVLTCSSSNQRPSEYVGPKCPSRLLTHPYTDAMNMPVRTRAEAVARIAACKADLRSMGVTSLQLFGSAGRDELTPRATPERRSHQP
jgi:hypothetical protein